MKWQERWKMKICAPREKRCCNWDSCFIMTTMMMTVRRFVWPTMIPGHIFYTTHKKEPWDSCCGLCLILNMLAMMVLTLNSAAVRKKEAAAHYKQYIQKKRKVNHFSLFADASALFLMWLKRRNPGKGKLINDEVSCAAFHSFSIHSSRALWIIASTQQFRVLF